MKRTSLMLLVLLGVVLPFTMGPHLNISGKCQPGQACYIGDNGQEPDSFTIDTNDTGDAEVVLPENSIGADDIAVATDHVVLCGQMDENGTIYFGPVTAAFGEDGSDASLSSAACDALDNATEATVDAPIFTDLSFKILGGWCKLAGTLGASETATFTVRTAAADVVTTDGSNTTLTCSLATGEVECSIPYGTTTDIAAGATIAIKAVQVSNNSDDDGWCRLAIAVK